MDLSNLTVTTTNGSKFTGEDSARLAFLIYRRFGCHLEGACEAWRRMLQNDCPLSAFADLVEAGREK